MDHVQETVFAIVAREGSVVPERVTLAATLKDLDIQSLDAVQIIFEIEDKFGIELPDRDPNFDTASVGGLVDAVRTVLAQKAAATGA